LKWSNQNIDILKIESHLALIGISFTKLFLSDPIANHLLSVID